MGGKTRSPYAAEFRQQVVELTPGGRAAQDCRENSAARTN